MRTETGGVDHFEHLVNMSEWRIRSDNPCHQESGRFLAACAAEISELRAVKAELIEALRPFAHYHDVSPWPANHLIRCSLVARPDCTVVYAELRGRDFRRAHRALKKHSGIPRGEGRNGARGVR